MSTLTIRALSKHFRGKPPTTAIDNLDLDVGSGEFLVLLGPSGCGKTTTLRAIAGLETPEQGSISFGGRPVFDAHHHINMAIHKRNLGMVFQSYAIWPHMTVRKNIGYPLRVHRMKREVANQWIDEVAELVDCGNLLDRYPGELSGGQQQRVALCRGLVARPDLLLFDEPLSNLDARLRDQVRGEIHELHQRLRFTALYVTHDQVEALALGDRLAVMRDGSLEQLGTSEEVFEQPATEYVAEFIGMLNALSLERRDEGWAFEGAVIADCPPLDSPSALVRVRSRPDDLELMPPEEMPGPGAFALSATVVDTEFAGRHVEVTVVAGGTRLRSRIPMNGRGAWAAGLDVGRPVLACCRWDDVRFYDAAGTRVRVAAPLVVSDAFGADG
jgi:iron(III) transport system ATP-binding protein